MSELKYYALLKKFEAEALESKAILEAYFANSVGIGEHPKIITEMGKLLHKLADAEGKIEALNKFITIREEKEE